MYTVKFVRDGYLHSISCPHYAAQEFAEGDWAITVYKDMLALDGVEWKVSLSLPDSFDTCFVENELGKTIARYSAKDHEE